MTNHNLTHADIAALRYCNTGARALCKRHGFDWVTFMREGIPLAAVENIDDDMVRKAVARARKRIGIEVAK